SAISASVNPWSRNVFRSGSSSTSTTRFSRYGLNCSGSVSRTRATSRPNLRSDIRLMALMLAPPGRVVNASTGRHNNVPPAAPVFANLVLADEINRAPAKLQSALLEAMQEQQATIGEQSHQLPRPFQVLATQNPIEQEGTYPLPEAQLDRFMFKFRLTYTSKE